MRKMEISSKGVIQKIFCRIYSSLSDIAIENPPPSLLAADLILYEDLLRFNLSLIEFRQS